MIIKKYNNNIEEWDNFVNNCWNGTIYHTRKFINYHPVNKFEDESIMIYDKNKLICVIPVCKNNDKYFSYKGSTYGGPVIEYKYMNIKKLTNLINLIFNYYDNKLEMRIANDIYFNYSQSSLIYLLQNKLNIKMELSWYITYFDINKIKNKDNKRTLSLINNYNVYITENKNDFILFYNILENTLKTRHNTTPTHSLDELLYLKNIFPNELKLCIVKQNNIILSGILFIKVNNNNYYTIYITKNYKINNISQSILSGSILYIIQYFMNTIKPALLDFGISTENRGELLNIGLSEFKQSSMTGISSYRYLFINI